MVDIGNTFVNAQCKELVYSIAGPEFGEYEGCIVVIVKALYGLKGSGSAWHAHFADTLRWMNFVPSKADPDMWMRPATKPDGSKYYEYLVVYVDDVLIVSHDTQSIVDALMAWPYELKGGTAPETYLGSTIGRYNPAGVETWYMSSEQYLDRAIGIVEEKMGHLPNKKVTTPLPTNFHPEIDTTAYLESDEAHYYLSLIGILQWINELGCIDICHAVTLMSRFNSLPRKGHLQAVLRIYAYLKQHRQSKLVFDAELPDLADIEFIQHDWHEFYPDAQEEIADDAPPPLGRPVQLNVFCDAAHADDFVTRRSTTGIILFVNGTPTRWYSKQQNTVESSTYGSEFVAMRIATELIIGLRNDLRMLGIPLLGPANVFCDNQSVVLQTTLPSSTLKKKHNSIAYHKVRESVAAGILRVAKEDTTTNLADVLTKPLTGTDFKYKMKHILF